MDAELSADECTLNLAPLKSSKPDDFDKRIDDSEVAESGNTENKAHLAKSASTEIAKDAISKEASDVIVSKPVPIASVNIVDENELPFDINEAFLQEQQMLYQQLAGSFRNDADTVWQQEEAFAKLNIKKLKNEIPENAEEKEKNLVTKKETKEKDNELLSEISKESSNPVVLKDPKTVPPSQPLNNNSSNCRIFFHFS